MCWGLKKMVDYSSLKVPTETKKKIKKFMEENNLPSMSQAMTVMAERCTTEFKCFDSLLTLSEEISERIAHKRLEEVSLGEVLKILREIPLESEWGQEDER